MNPENKKTHYMGGSSHSLTATDTFFLNKKLHLKILKNDIILKKKDFIYIWCITATSGEEIYSIIIELLEYGIKNFLIIASNINKKESIHFKKGDFDIKKLKNIPKNLIKKYFTCDYKNPDTYTIKTFLKKYFIFKKIDFIENSKFKKRINYIFCKNILIYYDRNTQEKIINNLLNNLDDYGYLFIEHIESLLNLTANVEAIFSSVYSKKN